MIRPVLITAALALAGCAWNPPPPEIQGPAPVYDPAAGPLEADGYRVGQRSDGAYVFDIRHTARDVSKLWIDDVADCAAAEYALKRGYVSYARIGRGEVQVEAGEGFPQPLMQGTYTYRLSLEGSGAEEKLATCREEGLI